MVHFTLSISNYPNSITARCLYLVHDSYLNWLSKHLQNKLQCKNCNLLGLPMMVHNKTPFFRTIMFGWVLLCRVDKLPGCSVECCYLKGTAPRGLRNDHGTFEKQNPIEMASWVGKRTGLCNCLVVSNIELDDSFEYFWETFMYSPSVVATDWLLRNNRNHWERSVWGQPCAN